MDISILLPNLLALYPRAEDLAVTVEDDQVGVCTGPEGALLVLDPEASVERGRMVCMSTARFTNHIITLCQRSLCRVQCRTLDSFAERATRELHKVADALVQGDHAKSGTGH